MKIKLHGVCFKLRKKIDKAMWQMWIDKAKKFAKCLIWKMSRWGLYS